MSDTHANRISNFGFRICRPTAFVVSREASVGVTLLRRVSSRGPRDVVSWCASACQMAAYRGPQQRPGGTAAGAAKPPRRPRAFQERTRPRGIGAQRRFRDRDEFGPLGAFLRLERRRDRPSGHPDREEGGKRSQRSGIGAIQYRVGGAALLECSPPARRRRAALEDGGTDERSRSEGTLSENAWPRSKTVAGGRARERVI